MSDKQIEYSLIEKKYSLKVVFINDDFFFVLFKISEVLLLFFRLQNLVWLFELLTE